MTYNIHHGRGLDFRVSMDRIAETIKKENPDIVGINEADKYNIRSWFVNQPSLLSRLLGMNYFFGQNLKLWFMRYGNIVLSKTGIINAENILLPCRGEQRGYIRSTLDFGKEKIAFICTHLDFMSSERPTQVAEIVDVVKKTDTPAIVVGDFNCGKEDLSPLLNLIKLTEEVKTHPASNPQHTIDHILCSHHFEIVNTYTVNSTASDHLPLVAILKL